MGWYQYDDDFGHFSGCLVLFGQTRIWQNQLSMWSSWRNIQIQSKTGISPVILYVSLLCSRVCSPREIFNYKSTKLKMFPSVEILWSKSAFGSSPIFIAPIMDPARSAKKKREEEREGRELRMHSDVRLLSVQSSKQKAIEDSKNERSVQQGNFLALDLIVSVCLGRNMAVKHCIALFFLIHCSYAAVNVCGNSFGDVINGRESDFEVSSEHVT